ncbi:uncharacterized protein LOC125371187 [Ricinus communis]|uniref:uncharacterized protein LOC125371187 n=1 Tax=Ricinus communis TaxID=3988 RepID=UPI00201AA0AC|nr:uncharacterized protein LOC125371187 [Ricinus communis]
MAMNNYQRQSSRIDQPVRFYSTLGSSGGALGQENRPAPNASSCNTDWLALRNQQASIQNFETQIGQISMMLAERQPRTQPNTIESNPMEHVNAIILQSSKYVPSPSSVSNNNPDAQVDLSREVEATKPKELEKEEAKEIPLREYQPKISFPTRLKQAQVEQQFGNLSINDALADLGSDINVMSYSLFAKLGLRETKPTRMSIQLADRSVKYPRGIVENVLIKVNKFIFPVDLVILDMNSESSVPLILDHNNVVYAVNVFDDAIETQLQEILVEDPLQVTLPMGDEHELSNEEMLEQLEFLLANESSNKINEFTVIDRISVQKLRPSLEEPLVLDLKELSQCLDYAHIDEDNNCLSFQQQT